MRFDPTILQKFLNGKFSLNDKQVVDDYFADDQYNGSLDSELNAYWKSSPRSNSDRNFRELLDKVNHRILLDSIPNKRKAGLFWQYYSRVAAVLLLPVLVVSGYFIYLKGDTVNNLSSFVEVHSPYGSRTKFSLPDGSTGWLNGGSFIRYPVQFGAQRNVFLEGEAFFEVTKNPQSPFIVDANSIQIKVLGTSFNVISYKEDSVSEVVVVTGKVEVLGQAQRFKQVLLPSERLVAGRANNQLNKSKVNVQNYIFWKAGRLMFLNDNLGEVVRKLSRYYHVDIEIEEDVSKTQQFRAIMQHESIDEILRYMKLTMDIDYVIRERTATGDNPVSMRKIVITKNKN